MGDPQTGPDAVHSGHAARRMGKPSAEPTRTAEGRTQRAPCQRERALPDPVRPEGALSAGRPDLGQELGVWPAKGPAPAAGRAPTEVVHRLLLPRKQRMAGGT